MAVKRTSKNKDLLDQLKDQTKNSDARTEATEFEKELKQRAEHSYTPEFNGHVAYSNVYNIEGVDTDIQINGVSPALANELFRKQIKKDEEAVKKLLKSAGLDTVPIPVFDALVSFQNQVGDASYIYYEGRKLSMLPWLSRRRWDRVADYLAADERDRARRAREASIIYNLDYGKNPTESQIIDRGFRKAIERAKKDPDYPPEKKAALKRAYFNHYGEPLKSLDPAELRHLEDEAMQKQLDETKGPWPY